MLRMLAILKMGLQKSHVPLSQQPVTNALASGIPIEKCAIR